MNLEQRLRENILRFGTKNLNENIKTRLLVEQDPNEFDPNDPDIPGDINPELDPNVDDKLPVGQRIKQTAKKVGKVTKDVLVTASLVGLLSKVIRNRLFKRYMRKNGIPTKEELIAKDSDRVKSHPAYQQTIDLMYRDKRTMKSASRYNVEGAKQTAGLPVLYWYGVPALGGETNPEDELNSKNMITIAKARSQKMANEIGEYTDDATKQEFTSLVNDFINGLQELSNSGIYITSSDLLYATDTGKYGAINYFLNRLLYGSDKEYEFMTTAEDILSTEQANQAMQVTKKLKNFLSAIKLGVADSGISPKGEKLRDLEIEATSTLTLSDEDKLGILTMFQEQSDEVGKPIIDATYWDIEAASIGIKANKALETTTVKGKKGSVVVTYEFFTIPNDPNSDEAKTAFFGNNDNKTNLTPDSIASMNDLLNKLIAQANKAGQQVVSVQYCAGAKTSAVGTTFGMSDKQKASADSYDKTEANVNLANSRCASILKAINEQVLPTIKSQPNMGDDKVSYGTVTAAVGGEKGIFAYPNCGPGWYEYSPSGTGYHKGTGYGPIFNNLYKILKENNPKVNGYALFPYYGIPQMFYICRNTPKAYERLSGYITALKNSDPKKYGTLQVPSQQQIEAEYQSVFSPFRGTYAGFLIGTMASTSTPPTPEQETNLEAEIEKFGEFEAMIDWTSRFVTIATKIGGGIRKFFGKIGDWFGDLEFPDIPKGAAAFPSSVQHLCNAYD